MPRKAKKKNKRMYFTQTTENAIIRYNNEDRPWIRDRLYRDHIQFAFEKLAENIIHTFKFYYFDVPSEDVKHEVVSFLVMNMHKFTEGKGKAFSYFSIVAKNYLILHNNNNYKKLKQSKQLDTLDYKRNYSAEEKTVEQREGVSDFVSQMVEYWDENVGKIFRRQKDIMVADSVIELFRRRDSIENFNKKALYILIREMTGSNTQHITRVINQMKRQYRRHYTNYFTTGSISPTSQSMKYMNMI